MKFTTLVLGFSLALTAAVAGCSKSNPPAAPSGNQDTMVHVNQDTLAHADGQPCESNDQCISGACEGSCEPGGGVCAPTNRGCTRDLVQYCSCDGATFESSGSCPGQRVAARGACPE